MRSPNLRRVQRCENSMARAYEFSLGGLDCAADSSGALYISEARMLVIADMHLEKSSHFAARGQFLPPYESETTLAALIDVISRFDPALVVALGDSFHDRTGHSFLSPANRAAIGEMQRGRDWLWIAGNHDPDAPSGIGGACAEDLAVGPLVLRHAPLGGDELEIAGHLHPVARLMLRGYAIQRRCFIHDERRIVLPAFGTFVGGLDVRSPEFAALFRGGKPSIHLLPK